ncbi:hypothetical protein CIT292_09134 [Citrobacter youngae ATCC 29220]|uniref:Uncharacterized protein n=1 Tax=Citrobacter youngae ATCC 29220 TaxID=500640 RepID=D4BFW4_9ENTR|nr:hypothetical protein CIT292_09134 [Citrobacter youngae ATCC 29220]
MSGEPYYQINMAADKENQGGANCDRLLVFIIILAITVGY